MIIHSAVACHICVLLGYFYPALASAKTAVQQDPAGFTQWMTYWVVMSFFALVELFFDFFVSWVPFYYEAKIVLIIWLTLPRYQGASQIYQRVIHPYLVQYEGKIDDGLEGMRVEATRRIQSLGASAATEIARAVSRQSSSAKEQLLARVLGVATSGADGTMDSSVPAKSAPSSSLPREASGLGERDKRPLLDGDAGESGTGGDTLERAPASTAESNLAMLEDFMEIMRGGVFVEAEMPSGAEDKQDGKKTEGHGPPRSRRIRVLDGKEFCIDDFEEQRAGQGGLEKLDKSEEERVGQAGGASGDRFLVLGALADPTSAESLLLETSLGEVRLRLPGEDDRDTLLMGLELLLLESSPGSPSHSSRTLHSEADTKHPVEIVDGHEEQEQEEEEEQNERGGSVPRSDHGVGQRQEKDEIRLDGGDENEDTDREEENESEEEEPPELLPPLRQSLVEVES